MKTSSLAPPSFSLDPRSNDTSLALDLLRALAGQLVCVGHAANIFFGPGSTYMPHIGVLLFFVLSGFVIAHTLVSKSANLQYGFAEFMIERTARIYTAYLPALLIIAVLDWLMWRFGHFNDLASIRPWVWFNNLLMMQNYPGSVFGTQTFGSAGHLSSLAAEFHIYVFVGALFFLFAGRNRMVSLFVAVMSAAVPLRYFLGVPGTDRALFLLWVMGFAAYFIVKTIKLDRGAVIIAALTLPALMMYWFHDRTIGSEYDINHYPLLALAFLALVVMTQGVHILSRAVCRRTIRFMADYAFSLFLLHYTVIKIVNIYWPGERLIGLIVALIAANLMAILFARYTEKNYHKIAQKMKQFLLRDFLSAGVIEKNVVQFFDFLLAKLCNAISGRRKRVDTNLRERDSGKEI